MERFGWRALSTAGMVVGLLFILSGRILELNNVGRGGVSAYTISMFSIPLTMLFFLLAYIGWYSIVRYIAAAHIGVTLFSALVIWQNIGGNAIHEAVFYNGLSDWIAFIGALVVTLGMLPVIIYTGFQIKLKR